MALQEQIERLWGSLLKLGSRRLIALGITGFSVFAMTGFAGYFLSRPATEVLYAGLDRQDAGKIAAALREADIPFDVSPDGNTVLVRYGETARARMLLAEKGLPNSPAAGNELYDKLGSLGLTSFMQEVTRVRALEGELARTLQLLRGVKAARVHIVLGEDGTFRRTHQPPSASVVIRTETPDYAVEAKAIQHLVAAAVPGMTLAAVTVLSTDGVLLSSAEEAGDAAPVAMLALEKSVAREIVDNVRKTLSPFLGLSNFQVSVVAKLNTDRKQTNETIFDPDSRVERSIRVVKQNQQSQNSATAAPATVQRNLPQENTGVNDGKQSNEESRKQEELTNYEVSSKTIATTSGGYAVDRLSVAVLVNKAALRKPLAGRATPGDLQSWLTQLEQLVASSAGTRKERGDTVKVVAVDFTDTGQEELAPHPGPGIGEMFLRQSGTIMNAGAILIVTLLLIWFGLRPATQAILSLPQSENPGLNEMAELENLAEIGASNMDSGELAQWPPGEINLIEDLTNGPKRSPQKRLMQIVEYDESQAIAVLKQWLHESEAA